MVPRNRSLQVEGSVIKGVSGETELRGTAQLERFLGEIETAATGVIGN